MCWLTCPASARLPRTSSCLRISTRQPRGSLLALYRLQKHPLVIEFYREELLQAAISDLQAKQVAEELVEFRKHRDFAMHSTP